MRGPLSLRRPVQTLALDMGSTNILTASWTQVIAAVAQGAAALEIFNPSGSPIKISQGAVGHEDDADKLLPWTIMPGGTTGIVPIEINAGLPITLKALDANIAAGRLILNFYA